ncbi:histidinol-phosphatase [bacterium]|nr:histidinol-phosphatase [bacterium]
MRIESDYHLHTSYCGHATGEMNQYVEAAVRAGLSEIGFSDHAPAADGWDPSHRMSYRDFDRYAREVLDLRIAYPDIRIRLGIEADIYPGFEKNLENLVSGFPVEYVLGSVHFIDGLPVFSKEELPLNPDQVRKFIGTYFDRLAGGFATGLFHAVGHLDVVKWNFPEYRSLIEDHASRLLAVVHKAGAAIELNTSGLRKRPGEMYPSGRILSEAARMGIPVIPGSDAHGPEQVGSHFAEAVSVLMELNYQPAEILSMGLCGFIPA